MTKKHIEVIFNQMFSREEQQFFKKFKKTDYFEINKKLAELELRT